MPGMLRPKTKAMKIAYAILKTPKDLRQNEQKRPSKKMVRAWFRDSSTAQ
jgi:hypothetical protein